MKNGDRWEVSLPQFDLATATRDRHLIEAYAKSLATAKRGVPPQMIALPSEIRKQQVMPPAGLWPHRGMPLARRLPPSAAARKHFGSLLALVREAVGKRRG